MKQFSLLVALVFTITATYARKVPGFIVFSNNDTIHTLLRIPGGLFGGDNYDIYKKIIATDSSGHDTTYMPGDIASYGFTDKSGRHLFRVKPLKDSSLNFQEVIVSGRKASVYFFDYPNNNSYGSGETLFTFEKADGTYLFLKNYDKLSTLRDKIKAFYGNTEAIRQFIDEKFQARVDMRDDIRAIVQQVNNATL
jgi:hypothetical protein